MTDTLNQGARFIAASLWAVIGLIFWVPMIFRVFVMQIGFLVAAALTRQDSRNIDGMVTRAITFYGNGFRIIFAEDQNDDGEPLFTGSIVEELIANLILVFGFYTGTLLFILALLWIF